MRLLTKSTDYAVRAVVELAMADDYLSVRDIAKAQHLPYQYLRQVMKKLEKSDFIFSKEGGNGGYRLMWKPSKIAVLDIIEAVQGGINFFECGACQTSCLLRETIREAEELAEHNFASLTIAELVDAQS